MAWQFAANGTPNQIITAAQAYQAAFTGSAAEATEITNSISRMQQQFTNLLTASGNPVASYTLWTAQFTMTMSGACVPTSGGSQYPGWCTATVQIG